MPELMILIASTRPGRVGLPVGEWFHRVARQQATFDVKLVDLKELELPFMDEPYHPRLRQYQHAHTRRWSGMVEAADAFVFVIPEYNFGFTAPLKNAIDYLSQEWQYKPVGFVSYGGVSGGTRAVQMAKQVVTALKMVPVPEAVTIPFVSQSIKEGKFQSNEPLDAAAALMLDELERWEATLRPMRKTVQTTSR